ncbi:MAG: L-2-amino-thiazoline-4-carboxylic acid hydrolase [Phycisphaerae bacterium]|jgi:predicted hydrocarbon binding protein|nr:L-2-amino-thiazoline-4-carboxylic acid hydrolase [Phycisphaerae bacterium]MDP7637616.1 L-2-amino-thiazoline-4-carboxylic acid hydrolase [Phycisphaerae bacterium]
MEARVQELMGKYELAVAFAKEFIAELGEARTIEILGRAFEKIQIKAGKDLATKLGSNSIQAMAEHSRKTASEKDNCDVLEVTDRHVKLKITGCPAHEAFKRLGAPEICKAYCDSDQVFIKAFNQKMKMIRTKTIAGGDDYCDHIWAMAD